MFSAAVITGCASNNSVVYRVTSTPAGAQVDVEGVEMGKTPTVIRLACAKRWVGVMNSPDGYANASGTYEVKVYPLLGTGGVSQTKRVNPCNWRGEGAPSINFDLALESFAPTQKIELSTTNGSEREKALNSLKSLRAQGVLTDEEYKQKVLKLSE